MMARQTALARLPNALLDQNPDLAFAGTRLHRSSFRDHGRESLAEIVKIARKQQRRPGLFARVYGRVGERQGQQVPAGIGRVQRMQNHIGVARRLGYRYAVERVRFDHLRALRGACAAARAHQTHDDPAGIPECRSRRIAQSSGCPEHQDPTAHSSPSSLSTA
jgi:hypothetical protein